MLLGHGQWIVDGVNPNAFTDDDPLWLEYIEKSGAGLFEGISAVTAELGYTTNALHFVGYSIGCFHSMDVAKRGLKPISMSMASPVPWTADNDEHSFVNNLPIFAASNLLLTGKNDEYLNPPDEVLTFYDLIESDKKNIIVYDSGHELPTQWTTDAIAFMTPLL